MQPQFISPVANRKQSRSKLPLILVIVGALIAIAAGIVVLIASAGSNPVTTMDKLNARMAALSSYVAEGRKSARSANLVKLNTDANILIIGDTAILKKVTKEAGATGGSKDIVASEKQRGDTKLKELQTASIDGRFDREYADVLEAELLDTQTLLLEVNNKSSSSSVKDATKTTHEHIEAILNLLDELSL